MFDLDYYKALKQDGYTSLTFDLKMDVNFCDGVSEAVKATTFEASIFGETKIQYQNGEKHTVTISLDKIILYYNRLRNNALSGANPATDWNTYVLFGFVFNDKQYNINSHENVTFTITNFQMVNPTKGGNA
jgi:hypothetical protein